MSGTGRGDGGSPAGCWCRRGCGRRTVACCDSAAAAAAAGQCAGPPELGAASDCSRSTRARCRSAESDSPPPPRSGGRCAATNRAATSSRPPSPGRRRTATGSPSSGRSPSLRRRLLARLALRKQPPAAALHFCNKSRASPPSCSFAPQSCVDSGGCGSGRRCPSYCRIPESFPKRASTGNWQVPSAPAGSKRAQNPLEMCLERTTARATVEGKAVEGATRRMQLCCEEKRAKTLPRFTRRPRRASWHKSGSVFSSGLPRFHSPCKRASQYGAQVAEMSHCACRRDLNIRTRPSRTEGCVKCSATNRNMIQFTVACRFMCLIFGLYYIFIN